MFYSCTSLTTAPVLPATTLNHYACYAGMFGGCSNLNSITCYATEFDHQNDLYDWVDGVSNTGIFYGHRDAVWNIGTDGVPQGWQKNIIGVQIFESSGTLGMYVDDFIKADPQDFVDNPIGNGCQAYEYTGYTMSYDGDDYYVWKNMGYMSGNSGESGGKTYVLTDTISQNTLQQKSLEYSTDNIWEHPICAVLNCNRTDTGYGESYNIVSVSQTTGLEMWIDDNFDYGWENDGYSDMKEYLDWYLDNIDEAGGKHYYYIDTFEYDGNNCYLWFSYNDRKYLVTDTINVSILTSYSIESNYSNVNTHPLITFLKEDLTEYNRDASEYSIVKVSSSQPKIMMYANDLLLCDYPIEDYIDEPDTYSNDGNYYEYCEPIEYDGDTYYIWKNMLNDYDLPVYYILTDTINLQTLQSQSLESSLSNITIHPIVSYLAYDLDETYEGTDRFDNIVKVFEL
jgi:hypothetical protein